uniref:Activin types I and II receptor domain-containing protein n=1 Tax=Cyprinus carpio TaxID=7962 RepID=A0A8C2GHH3_CYPCA
MPWFHARVSGMELQVQTRWTSLLFLLGSLWLCSSTQANVLESMLQRNSGKLTTGGGKESSGSATPVIPERMLLCHCYHHCPEDSTNNTCRTDGYCFTMVEEEEGSSPLLTSGCLGLVGSEFQCRDTGNARLRRILECCTDQDFCNRDLHPTLPPLKRPGAAGIELQWECVPYRYNEKDTPSHGSASVS